MPSKSLCVSFAAVMKVESTDPSTSRLIRRANTIGTLAVLVGLVSHLLLWYIFSIAERDASQRIPHIVWHGPLANYVEILSWFVACCSIVAMSAINYVRKNAGTGADA